MRVPDDDLAEIDAEAGSNRTRFILGAVRAHIAQRKRERLDHEIGRLLTDDGQEHLAIDREFAETLVDGFA